MREFPLLGRIEKQPWSQGFAKTGPRQLLVSLCLQFHDFVGLPWWQKQDEVVPVQMLILNIAKTRQRAQSKTINHKTTNIIK